MRKMLTLGLHHIMLSITPQASPHTHTPSPIGGPGHGQTIIHIAGMAGAMATLITSSCTSKLLIHMYTTHFPIKGQFLNLDRSLKNLNFTKPLKLAT